MLGALSLNLFPRSAVGPVTERGNTLAFAHLRFPAGALVAASEDTSAALGVPPNPSTWVNRLRGLAIQWIRTRYKKEHIGSAAFAAGVNVTLCTWGARTPAVPEAGRLAVPPVPREPPPPAAPPAPAFHMGAQPFRSLLPNGAGQSRDSRPRKRTRAAAVPAAGGRDAPSGEAGPGLLAGPTATEREVGANRDAPGCPAPLVDRSEPTHEYVLIRQWGFTFQLTLEGGDEEPREASGASAPEGPTQDQGLKQGPAPEARNGHAEDPDGTRTRQKIPAGAPGQQSSHRPPGRPQRPGPAGGTRKPLGRVLKVDIQLKAVVPTLSPESSAVVLRMLDRYQSYSQFSPYWMVRPLTSVSCRPVAWWWYGIGETSKACWKISRHQVRHVLPLPCVCQVFSFVSFGPLRGRPF